MNLANTAVLADSVVIDELTKWTFVLPGFAGVAANDYVILKFPSMFSGLSRSTSLSIDVGALVNQPFTIYTDENMIAVKVNGTEGGTTPSIVLAGFRNP